MKIKTRKFGEIDIDEETILTMPEGLPGFPGYEHFVVIEDPKTDPFCWFQCVDEPNLNLVIMNPFLFKPDYSLDIKTIIELRHWQGIKEDELVIFVVINISGEGKEKLISANLLGPLVINPRTREAVQFVISDTRYSLHHNVLESIEGFQKKDVS